LFKTANKKTAPYPHGHDAVHYLNKNEIKFSIMIIDVFFYIFIPI
jgi:hypothetical protein